MIRLEVLRFAVIGLAVRVQAAGQEACLGGPGRHAQRVGGEVQGQQDLFIGVADSLKLALQRFSHGWVDTALARDETAGPFLGVPFTVKDVFDTEGIVTAVGLTERRDFVPDRDAVAVARLRGSGAILIAQSNCPEGGAGGDTDHPVQGRNTNPYDLARTPGASSGGEAALLGAGCSLLGLGSDSGGSIRLRAHYCGVAGLKPTAGRASITGAYEHPGGLSDV